MNKEDAVTVDAEEKTEGTENEQQQSEKTDKKEKTSVFGKSLKEYIDRGVEASMKGFVSAGNALSEFGDKSVVHFEISTLNSKMEKLLKEVGQSVYDAFEGGRDSVSKTDEAIASKFESIRSIKEKIAEKEESLKKYEK